ncbi:MAG: cytochrome c [Paracoccaceae bacterium]|nr:cytochrome c [Paracoccaceae bacterium]
MKVQKACLAAAAAVLMPLSAVAQDAGIGETLYNQYCATCHGLDGAGEGPLTQIMVDKPSDLRLLSANNPQVAGEFPMLHVIHVIDGRTGLRAHGGPMPTYGDIFMSEETGDRETYGAVLATRGRVLSLAMYLESIQN